MSNILGLNQSPVSLSVCIVTQDMAHFLPSCLDSVEEVADEVVVVDGFSKDHTVDLLRSRPKVRFMQRRFEGHFGEQKNFAIEQCRGDWVLILDSDEVLGDRCRERLPKLIRSRRFTHYKLARYWLVDGPEWTYVRTKRHYPDFQLRLFRKHPVFRYSVDKVVHTHFPRNDRGPGKKLRDCHIFHFDFILKGREERESKYLRYLSLEPSSRQTSSMYLYEDFSPKYATCKESLSTVDLTCSRVRELALSRGVDPRIRAAAPGS